MVVPSFRKSVFFGDFFCYPVHGPESVKIGCAADQHHFFEFPGMEILETGNLFPISDTGFDHRFLCVFIIGFCR